MAYIEKSSGGDFQNVPAGTHPAVCYRVIDLGTQKVNWQGEEKSQHKILVSWEICDPELRMDDGRPFTIGTRYTWSMHEKARLRADLESWRGKTFTDADFIKGPGGFEIQNIIGVGCYLSIVHTTKDGKTYANIKAVSKLPRGTQVPPPENPRNFVWLTKDEFVESCFDHLTDGLKRIVTDSPEYKKLVSGEPTSDAHDVQVHELDDEIPFS